MLITQTLNDLLGGVSQELQQLRDGTQAEEQVNLSSHRTKGLRKRSPTRYVAKLTSDVTGYDSAFDYPVNRSDEEKFRVVIVNGDLKVYDTQTGAEQTVLFPEGKAYLTGDGSNFRAVMVGDTIIIVNRKIVGATDTTKKAPDSTPQALLSVKLGDYSTTYIVILDGITVAYRTPQPLATNAKQAIGTDEIAAALVLAITSNTTLNANYTVTRYGSAVHLVRKNSADFTLTASDGLGGTGLKAIKGSVQLFTDLPAAAKEGMIVEVVGSPESDKDNYFVQYSESATSGQAGTWKEIVSPGALTDVDATTMPHVLVFDGAVISDEPQHGPVAIPVSTHDATSTWDDGWSTDQAGATSGISVNADQVAYNEGTGFIATPSATSGAVRTVVVSYDIDTSQLLFDYAKVSVFRDTGPATAFTLVQEKDYGPGNVKLDEQISFTGTLQAGMRVKILLNYGAATTPPAGDEAILTAHSKVNDSGSGVHSEAGSGTRLTFDPTEKYPAGTTLIVTLDGNNFVYAIGLTDQTGAQAATGIAALIDPDATYAATNPSSGVILFTQGSGVPPVVSVASSLNLATTFWNADLALVSGAHVGGIIRNLTDGSSGTITANTSTTISAPLSGGADNTFQEGDLCELVSTGTYFVFKSARWTARKVGDDRSNPFPALVGQAIDDVFHYENRLGFTVGENVCLSCAGSDLFNFFRTTVTDLLAKDTIAVKPPGRQVVRFDNAVPWTNGVYLFTEQGGEFFRLSGNPVLTPTTVRIDVMGKYSTTRDVRPVVAGSRLVLTSVRNGVTRAAFAEQVLSTSSTASVRVKDITKHIPTYIVGNPIAIVVDDEAEVIFLVTDAAIRSVFVCFYGFSNDGEFTQLAWSRWDFSYGTKVVGVDLLNGVLGLVLKRSDGAHLESITLDPEEVMTDNMILLDGSFTLDGSVVLTGNKQ